MDIPKPSRNCSVTGREFQPGDAFFSFLVEGERDVKRVDVGTESWEGPPTDFLGWWRTKVPEATTKKVKLAPNDILFNLFDNLRLETGPADMLYVLTLLMIRRRLLRYEKEEDRDGQKFLVVYAVKENATYEILTAMPDRERLAEVQEELSQLLYSE